MLLRHVLGSMVWSRFEAVRAFEDEVQGAVDPTMAYHLAVAISGLHFVLGLAARASAEVVRDLSDRLNDAEHRVMEFRNARRTADLVAGAGGTPQGGTDSRAVPLAWEAVCSEQFRDRLASAIATI